MRLTAARISSGLAASAIALPSDLLIFALPSRPGSLGTDVSNAEHSTSTSAPTLALKLRTSSLVCSIIGNWSLPTGTTVAWKAVMSAAWLTG